jgi:uncharacterized protein (TIGR03437 family)
MKRASLLISALIAGAALWFVFPTSAERLLAPSLSLVTQFAPAAQPPDVASQGQANRRRPQTREDFDARANLQRTLDEPRTAGDPTDTGQPGATTRSAAARSALKRARPSAQMKWSSLSGAPSRIWSFSETLTAPSNADAETIARRFLKNNHDLFHLNDPEVDGLKVSRRYRTEHNGVTHLTLQQQVNGLEVFQADLAVHLDRDGAVVAASGELIAGAARAANLAQPKLAAAEALRIAAQDVEAEIAGALNLRVPPSGVEQRQEFDRAAGFASDVPARLVYFPLATDQLRLSWEFIVWMRETPDVYLIVVDAERGSIFYRRNFTSYDENPLRPHGQVYTKESPRPNLPRTSPSPPVVAREDLPFRAAPFNGRDTFAVSDQHYDWWAAVPANNLVSNNTSTYLDRDGTPNQPDQPRLTAADGNFSFPVDLTLEPTTENNQKAAQVNLFYWVNRYHDILYTFGFNEAAGNFQTNNFNLGGRGADAINAEAQDGAGTNNANFATPPDGSPGRVQMFLWTGTPQRDGDFDQGVIIHELTHGLSNRLVFNATGLFGLQGGGMGEGWSDWFALTLLANEGDDPAALYPVGQFALNNYTAGIRRYPYSTLLQNSPLTYKDVAIRNQVHALGEIWCNTLWEMRALLIGRYGFREGQRQSIQLVVDGLKLTPRGPTFVDARNAILLADRVNNQSANQCLLWQAFAKRGLGFDASTIDTFDGAPVESLDSAPYCRDVGAIRLDKSHYLTNETVRISLGDRNTATAQVSVSSATTGDQETLNLAPETGIPGSFNGAIRLASGRARPGDGLLQGSVEMNDTIVVTYNDANGGGGFPTQAQATASLARERTLFEDNAESGNQGWLPTGTWALTNAVAASPTRSWTDSPAGNYAINSNTSLTSPLFDLTGLAEVSLSFAHAYAIETSFDFGLVEFSTDDGATWKRATAFTGLQSGFTQAQIRLRALDGQPRARVRFRLTTDNSVVADGWYVDDIRIIGRSVSPLVIPPGGAQPPPAIASLTPAFGPPAGGTRVTILGSNFTENADTTVTFDGIPAASVNVLGGTVLTAVAPPHAAGPAAVRVANRHGAVSLASGFTYYTTGSSSGAPTLTSLYPSFGSTRGGTAVTLIGANFTPETVVTFGATRGAAVFVNANTLRAVAPANNNTGAVDVTAANGANQAKLTGGFNYIVPTPPTVDVAKPLGGETLFAGSVYTIRWSSADNRAVAAHRLSLFRATPTGLQFVSDIATVSGQEQSFNWQIPINVPITDARIRVRATDDEGTETEAYSSGNFALARRWEIATPMPAPISSFAAVSDGRYIYRIGGFLQITGTPATDTVQRLDPTAAAPVWTNVAPLPTGLVLPDAVFIRGKIYVPGGIDPTGQRINRHFVYDVATNTWTTQADVPAPTPASSYVLAADEARGVYYYTGGFIPTGRISAVRAFDTATNTWSELPPLGTARNLHRAALIEGRLYVAGGIGNTGLLASAEVFDFSTRQWTAIAPMNSPRSAAASFVGRDASGNPFWFVVGGTDGTGALLGAEVYDLRNNRWIALDNSFGLPTPRTTVGGATVGNFFYVYGSNTAATAVANERLRIDPLTLVPVDIPPSLAVPVAQIAVPNVEVKFNVRANDLGSGVPLSLTASGLPSGANFNTTPETNNSVRGTFRWTPAAADVNKTFTVSFTASDGQLSETKRVGLRVVEASRLAAVNGADYRTGPIAPDSIASAFGVNLAVRAEVARDLPLPFDLAGTTVTINGLPAPLLSVSPTQINFAVPAGVEPGTATIVVSNPAGNYAAGTVEITAAAPALFTANATGRGDASALATVDGVTFQPPPFDVVVGGRPNIVVFFGTGIRRAPATNPNDDNGVAESVNVTIDGRQARTLYAGAQGTFTGLDQINVELPTSLAGGGLRRVEVVVTVNNVAANRVTIQIK